MCLHCPQSYYLHLLSRPPQTQPMLQLAMSQRQRPPSHTSSSTPESSFPAWMAPGTFSEPSSCLVNQERMRSAQRHQPPPHQLPQPARGVSASPLLPLPMVAMARVTSRGGNVKAGLRQRQMAPSLSNQTSYNRVDDGFIEVRYIICIHPEPVCLPALCLTTLT
jgi:hypothetical protein